jgi:hypothetical protein
MNCRQNCHGFEFIASCTSDGNTEEDPNLCSAAMSVPIQQAQTTKRDWHPTNHCLQTDTNDVLECKWSTQRPISLTESLAEQCNDTALIKETHLHPTKKWSIPDCTIYRTATQRPPHGRTPISVRSPLHHHKSNPPQLTALEVTAVNIPTRRETLTSDALYAPPIITLLAQELTTLTQYNQHFIFTGDYNAKHATWHSRLTNTRGRILHDHAL